MALATIVSFLSKNRRIIDGPAKGELISNNEVEFTVRGHHKNDTKIFGFILAIVVSSKNLKENEVRIKGRFRTADSDDYGIFEMQYDYCRKEGWLFSPKKT
ncbi:MAG: hypothetical protein K6G36_01175 [Candidatus Saccharibacteria bacterium]|nr:hypothetical protein [Candidatus Saccharibacteria bacterium]